MFSPCTPLALFLFRDFAVCGRRRGLCPRPARGGLVPLLTLPISDANSNVPTNINYSFSVKLRQYRKLWTEKSGSVVNKAAVNIRRKLRSRLLSRSRIPEEQRYAPCRRQCNQDIDDTADNSALTSKKPRHQVKTEYPDKTPVEPADYQQNECKFIYPHFFPTFQNCADFPAAVIMHKTRRIIMSIYFFTTHLFYGKISIYYFHIEIRRATC